MKRQPISAPLAVCLSAFVGQVALAKPPLQLAGPGVRVEPLAIAAARVENGTFIFGEWQEYAPVQSRGAKGYYYVFDCFGGYVFDDQNPTGYVNHAHAGRGALPSEARAPTESRGACGLGSSRWYFGASYNCPINVEDIQSLAPGAQGGSPIDGIDVAWYWGGGECVLAFFPSDDSSLCENGDPFDHAYGDGLVINLGDRGPGGYYYVNINGILSQNGIVLPTPPSGGSYLAALLNPDGSMNVNPGTQFMLWGTGDAGMEPFRAGRQASEAWDDDAPIDGLFGRSECYEYGGPCPDPLGKCVGFLALRCPADLNWDGFVNGADYDAFADWLDQPYPDSGDLNGDGFTNADDFGVFVSWFEHGC